MDFSQMPGFFLLKGALFIIVFFSAALFLYNIIDRSRRIREREQKKRNSQARRQEQHHDVEETRVRIKQQIEQTMHRELYHNDI